jgi:predicted metal-dependent peptidase
MTIITQAVSGKQRLSEIKTAMLMYSPFFASLLYDMMEIKLLPGDDAEIPTLGTDGKTIYINESFFGALPLLQAYAAMCHEIAHAMWMHFERGKVFSDMGFEGRPFRPALYNIAGDFVINDMLKACNIGELGPGWLWSPKYKHTMNVDDVYRELEKEFPPQLSKQPQQNNSNSIEGSSAKNNSANSNSANGNNVNSNSANSNESNESNAVKDMEEKVLDKHIFPATKVQEAEWRRAIKSAYIAAKAVDKMPEALERFVTEFLNPQILWQEKLRFHVIRVATRDIKSWGSPHRRRLITQRLFYPRNRGFGAGEIVVAVDTSGSISEAELNTFFGELASIIDDCNPETVWVLSIDAHVNSVERLDSGHDLRQHPPKIVGGGGTSFIPAFEWCDNEGIIPSVLIYFTDLHGEYPKLPPTYSVIWCVTNERKATWGESIQIKVGK